MEKCLLRVIKFLYRCNWKALSRPTLVSTTILWLKKKNYEDCVFQQKHLARGGADPWTQAYSNNSIFPNNSSPSPKTILLEDCTQREARRNVTMSGESQFQDVWRVRAEAEETGSVKPSQTEHRASPGTSHAARFPRAEGASRAVLAVQGHGSPSRPRQRARGVNTPPSWDRVSNPPSSYSHAITPVFIFLIGLWVVLHVKD